MASERELQTIKQLLDMAESNIQQAKSLLFARELASKAQNLVEDDEGKIIEGIFDGEFMVGPAGKKYPVSANYASKSKLLPGDVLKLTIAGDGTFLFKQIGPVKRKTLIGDLESAGNKFIVKCGKSKYRISSASVSYFKAESGDKMTILVPEEGLSEWAAVENLLEDVSV